MEKVESIKESAEDKQKEKEARDKYRKEMKQYEKLGALKFQQVVFKVEKLKFKILKKFCPNFIEYFDKYIDWNKKKKIMKINKKENQREYIGKKYPNLLSTYDKYSESKKKLLRKTAEVKDRIRRKVKASNPKIIEFYDKYLKVEDPLKGLEPEQKIKKIKEMAKFSKMFMRKEFIQEKNRNYHIDSKKPTEIYPYLEWNKKIHVRGIMKDILIIPLITIATCLGFPLATPLLIIELLSLGLNFECVNIQNYSMCRFKISEKVLRRQEEIETAKSIIEHGKANEIICKSIMKSDDLPKFSEVAENFNELEQLKQMREKIRRIKEERELSRKEKKITSESNEQTKKLKTSYDIIGNINNKEKLKQIRRMLQGQIEEKNVIKNRGNRK